MLVVSVSVSGSIPRNCWISGPKTVEKNVRLNQPIFFEFKKIKNPRFLGFFVSKQYFGIGRFKRTFLSQFLVAGGWRVTLRKHGISSGLVESKSSPPLEEYSVERWEVGPTPSRFR